MKRLLTSIIVLMMFFASVATVNAAEVYRGYSYISNNGLAEVTGEIADIKIMVRENEVKIQYKAESLRFKVDATLSEEDLEKGIRNYKGTANANNLEYKSFVAETRNGISGMVFDINNNVVSQFIILKNSDINVNELIEGVNNECTDCGRSSEEYVNELRIIALSSPYNTSTRHYYTCGWWVSTFIGCGSQDVTVYYTKNPDPQISIYVDRVYGYIHGVTGFDGWAITNSNEPGGVLYSVNGDSGGIRTWNVGAVGDESGPYYFESNVSWTIMNKGIIIPMWATKTTRIY